MCCRLTTCWARLLTRRSASRPYRADVRRAHPSTWHEGKGRVDVNAGRRGTGWWVEPVGSLTELGPAALVLLRNAVAGAEAIVVCAHNVAAGPADRRGPEAPDVTVEEVARLAGPHTQGRNSCPPPPWRRQGGDHRRPTDVPVGTRRPPLLVRSIDSWPRPLHPRARHGHRRDLHGLGDRTRSGGGVGLPSVLGGIPFDEVGATGWGVAVAGGDRRGRPRPNRAQGRARRHPRLRGGRPATLRGSSPSGARSWCRSAIVPAASPTRMASTCPSSSPGSRAGKTVGSYSHGESGTPDAPLWADCDIVVPAARGDVITTATVGLVRARLVLEGANIPITPEAEAMLHDRGVLCIPDWIANAGGVICGRRRVSRWHPSRGLQPHRWHDPGEHHHDRGAQRQGVGSNRATLRKTFATRRVEKAMRLRRS